MLQHRFGRSLPCLHLFLFVLGLIILLNLFSVSAEEIHETRSDLVTLEALVEQWTQLRLDIADEKRSWDEKKRQWRNEVALLQKEKESLLLEIESATQAEKHVEDERVDTLRKKERLSEILNALPPMLARAEAALQRWPDRLPPPLRKPLDSAFRSLALPSDMDQKLSDGARLQQIVGLYAAIEKLHSNIHVVKEILPVPDRSRREVDVCYVGLARGFAVSSDNRWAAVGTPSDKGWVWNTRTDIAREIRKAISIHQHEQEAGILTLPMKIVEVVP